MTVEHTPGPWEICPSFGGNPDAFSISLVGDDRLIATAWDRDAFDRAHPAQANAHLIAAAPDLLEALDNEVMAECVYAWVAEKGIDKQEYNHRRTLAEKIQAAIAKARGQS